MGRYDDIDPQDIDPDTGRPYPNYSSPALEPFTDAEPDDAPRDDVLVEVARTALLAKVERFDKTEREAPKPCPDFLAHMEELKASIPVASAEELREVAEEFACYSDEP